MKRHALLVVTALTGCLGDEGPPNPVRPETEDMPPAATPGSLQRRVAWQSPFGGPAGNLLVDGDFEHSVAIQGAQPQSGWLVYEPFGGYLRGETGGLCKSGLRCGILTPGMMILGRGTAARDSGIVASVWAKPPPDRDCSAILASVLDYHSSAYLIAMPPREQAPAEDGWCLYENRVPRRTGQLMLVVEVSLMTGQTALVDAAAFVPDTGTSPLQAKDSPPPSQERLERYAAALAWVRSRTKLGHPLEGRPQIGQE